MKQPQNLNEVIGNGIAIERLRKAITDNHGLGGLVIMLQGQTGNGKTLIADILAGMADGDVYRPDCTRDADTGDMIEHIKSLAGIPSMFGGLSVFIFDECDRLSSENIARLKTTIDSIERRKSRGESVSVMLIFTTAKVKDQLTDTQKKHWDELVTRCVLCPVGVTKDELNDYFAKATGGELTNISWKIRVQSVRAAWEYVKANGYSVVDVPVESEPFVLPESGGKRVGFVSTKSCSCNRKQVKDALKKQQGLVNVIRDIVASIGEPVSYAAVRSAIDESGSYVFKRGCEGWRRTNQIVSAVHNHIKKYGESAVLYKTADGKIALR